VANRVLVFYDGRIVRDFSRDAMNYQAIAAAMTGQ
jgi:ABC-type sugar transport system ATPase subunit